MGIGGHRLTELFREHQLIDANWKETAYSYWKGFLQDVRDKGFQLQFNHKAHTIEIVKEEMVVLSLHFNKSMLTEEVDIRYSLELVDSYLFEEMKEGNTIRYNGEDWRIISAKGDWIIIQSGGRKPKRQKVHRKVLEKQNPDLNEEGENGTE